MSAHVLLNFSKKLEKRVRTQGFAKILFYRFFTTNLINSIKQEHKC